MTNPRKLIVAALETVEADHKRVSAQMGRPVSSDYMAGIATAIVIVERALADIDDTADELAKLLAHNAELLKKYQWQPIETAPKDGSEFLGWCGVFHWAAHWDAVSEVTKSGDGYGVRLTHWMPLPEPPEVSDAAN